MATLSVGTSRVIAAANTFSDDGLRSLLGCLEVLGARIDLQSRGGAWVCDIAGRGLGGLVEPDEPLTLAGPEALQLVAILASHPVRTVLAGTALPSDLLDLLRAMGASIKGRDAEADPAMVPAPFWPPPFWPPPFWIDGAVRPVPPQASISARPGLVLPLLLAALNIPGEVMLAVASSTARRFVPLLEVFGADVAAAPGAGEERIIVRGEAELVPAVIHLREPGG